MGGCAASRLGGGGEEEDAVVLCRERKRLMKAAVDRRYALAEAHSRYTHSLYAMAGAITLFVARHSSPAPILITLPPSSPPSSASEPSFLQHTLTEPKTEAAAGFRWSPSSSPSSSSAVTEVGEGDVGEVAAVGLDRTEEAVGVGGGEMDYGRFFSGMPPPPPSPMRSFGWDFFDPFDGVRAAEQAAMLAGLNRSSEEDLRVVREEEGIPELEEEGQQDNRNDGGDPSEGGGSGKLVNAGNASAEADASVGEMVPRAVDEVVAGGGVDMGVKGEKGLTVMETPGRERELLDALRDVVDHFIRAYDSGKEVSKMLEATMMHFQPGMEGRKGCVSQFALT